MEGWLAKRRIWCRNSCAWSGVAEAPGMMPSVPYIWWLDSKRSKRQKRISECIDLNQLLCQTAVSTGVDLNQLLQWVPPHHILQYHDPALIASVEELARWVNSAT
jgi:hypothetical protein